MARKNRFGTLMAMAAGAATTATLITYDRQKREILARLQAGSQVAQTTAGPVEYAVVGEGPAVLSVHGAPGGYDQGLMGSSHLVAAGFKVIAISRFGYLRTPPASNMSPEAQADQFAAMLDELNVADVAVVAASGGGPSSLQFALRYPDRCRALVMTSAVSLATPHGLRDNLPSFPLIRNIMRSDFLMWLAITGALNGLPLFIKVKPEAQQNAGENPAQREMFEAAMHSLFPMSLRQVGFDNDMVQIETLANLPLERITSPTLVLHGTADSLVPFANAENTASRIPGARLIPIEGGEHLFSITHHDQVWPEMIAFLKKKKPPVEKSAKKAPAKKTPARKPSTRKKAS